MIIQWYPGHIAKALKNLKEQLKRVDVILEVRDLRIPLTTRHPELESWIGDKARLLILNRMDLISEVGLKIWKQWFMEEGEFPYVTNAQQGQGVESIIKAAKKVGVEINEKRAKKGMLPRPVRAVVIGFPNVGKSALINRLLKRRVVNSAATPGVTRSLRWVKISDELELLDAPGVIPSKLEDQEAAIKLAICDDIGGAAYDNQRVAIALIRLLYNLELSSPVGVFPIKTLVNRYELEVNGLTPEDYLHRLSELKYKGDLERTANQLLTDFRKGYLGKILLELPN